MTMTNITLSPEPNQVESDWQFSEVWIDPMLTPPYVLLLIADSQGKFNVYDPAKDYQIIFSTDNTKRQNYGCWKMNMSQYKEYWGLISCREKVIIELAKI